MSLDCCMQNYSQQVLNGGMETYLSSVIQYFGGIFLRLCPNTHPVAEEIHHASISCFHHAKRKPVSKDETSGQGVGSDGPSRIITVWKQGWGVPHTFRRDRRSKCGGCIILLPMMMQNAISPNCLLLSTPSPSLSPSDIDTVCPPPKPRHFLSKHGISSSGELESYMVIVFWGW